MGLVDAVRILEPEGRDRRELDETLGAATGGGVDHPAGPEHVHAPDLIARSLIERHHTWAAVARDHDALYVRIAGRRESAVAVAA